MKARMKREASFRISLSLCLSLPHMFFMYLAAHREPPLAPTGNPGALSDLLMITGGALQPRQAQENAKLFNKSHHLGLRTASFC